MWRRVHGRLSVAATSVSRPNAGLTLLPAGGRRRRLEKWFGEGISGIVCIPWEAPTGLRWAKLLADLRRSGESLPVKDSLIAATALLHDLIVVTRNTRDFRKTGARVFDPFA
jgi:toxin FitB